MCGSVEKGLPTEAHWDIIMEEFAYWSQRWVVLSTYFHEHKRGGYCLSDWSDNPSGFILCPKFAGSGTKGQIGSLWHWSLGATSTGPPCGYSINRERTMQQFSSHKADLQAFLLDQNIITTFLQCLTCYAELLLSATTTLASTTLEANFTGAKCADCASAIATHRISSGVESSN